MTTNKITALNALIIARQTASTAIFHADQAEREAIKAKAEAQAALIEIQTAIDALKA